MSLYACLRVCICVYICVSLQIGFVIILSQGRPTRIGVMSHGSRSLNVFRTFNLSLHTSLTLCKASILNGPVRLVEIPEIRQRLKGRGCS